MSYSHNKRKKAQKSGDWPKGKHPINDMLAQSAEIDMLRRVNDARESGEVYLDVNEKQANKCDGLK